MMEWIRIIFATVCMVAATAAAHAREPVDVALVLAVDVSRSMSPRELKIQRDGYAAALNHPDVVRAISQGAYGRIAVTMFEWAGSGSVRQVLDWTLVETGADADRVARTVRRSEPAPQRRTSISGAILHGLSLLDAAPTMASERLSTFPEMAPTIKVDRCLRRARKHLSNGLSSMDCH
jgi:hypothetical protein